MEQHVYAYADPDPSHGEPPKLPDRNSQVTLYMEPLEPALDDSCVDYARAESPVCSEEDIVDPIPGERELCWVPRCNPAALYGCLGLVGLVGLLGLMVHPEETFVEAPAVASTSSGCVVGMLSFSFSKEPPEGWRVADGSVLPAGDFPELAALLGAEGSVVVLPDLLTDRLFLRAGAVPGATESDTVSLRGVGIEIEDAGHSHGEEFNAVVVDGTGIFKTFNEGTGPNINEYETVEPSDSLTGISATLVGGGVETRPRNMAAVPLICVHNRSG